MRIQWRSGALVALLCVHGSVYSAELTVAAAASLKEAFTRLARQYEQQNPSDQVRLTVGASGVLMQQLAQGAPIDVLATADQDTMDQAAAQNLIQTRTRQDFARNQLVLIQPIQPLVRSESIRTITDLNRSSIQRIAVGNPATVPAGRYARDILMQGDVWNALQAKLIMAQNVRQVLAYVATGEVDAGLVYATDARTAPDTVRVAARLQGRQPIRYAIAISRQSSHTDSASRFIAFVQSAQGHAILKQEGFLAP